MVFEAPPPPWNPAPVVHESPASPRPGRWTCVRFAGPGRDRAPARDHHARAARGSPASSTIAARDTLCLTLTYGTTRTALCVAGAKGRPILRRVPLVAVRPARPGRRDRDARGGARSRPRSPPRTSVSRSARSNGRWCRCGTARVDQLPEVDARARLFAVPECFGAAARAPGRPCVNPLLRTVVTPTPDEALLTPNAPCAPVQARSDSSTRATSASPPSAPKAPSPCSATAMPSTGERRSKSSPSPSAGARSRCRGRAARSTPRAPSCARPATAGLPPLDRTGPGVPRRSPGGPHGLRRRARERGLRARPGHRRPRGASLAARERPPDLRAARHAGSAAAGGDVRGPPPASGRRRSARPARCRAARPWHADPQLRAAGGRVRVLDFTSYFCDASKCPSVIGGVLVRKDGSHLTRAFSATLGPFVLRSVS